MESIKLVNGYEIPSIGFGTFPQKETLPQNLLAAYCVGFRMFDTSDNYDNEKFVGEGIDLIRERNASSNENDESVIVISKFSIPRYTDKMEKHFLDSQKKCGGKIDVYLLHWPYPFLWKQQWKRMEDLYLSGKVSAIGVCNFEVKHLKRLLSFCRVPPAINQFERHPMFQQREIVDFCQNHGIKTMCYAPIARGDKDLMDSEVLKEIAEKYGKTIGQIILRWDIDTGTIPIPGSSSYNHIQENYNVFDFELTQKEISAINNMELGKRIRFDPNKRFSKKEKYSFLKIRIKMFIRNYGRQ